MNSVDTNFNGSGQQQHEKHSKEFNYEEMGKSIDIMLNLDHPEHFVKTEEETNNFNVVTENFVIKSNPLPLTREFNGSQNNEASTVTSKNEQFNETIKVKQIDLKMASKMMNTTLTAKSSKIANSNIGSYSDIFVSTLEHNGKGLNNKNSNPCDFPTWLKSEKNESKTTSKISSAITLIKSDKTSGNKTALSPPNITIERRDKTSDDPTNAKVETGVQQQQKSLLKNHFLDIFTSPRSKQRSQSLNSINEPHEAIERKMSTSSEGKLQNNDMETVYVIDDDDMISYDEVLALPEFNKISSTNAIHNNNHNTNNNNNQIGEGKTLLCDEDIEMLPCSGSSPSSNNSKENETSLLDPTKFSTVIDMMSTFNILAWKERIGHIKETKLKFQLNEFNLLEIHELCPPRDQIHMAYEIPIHERSFPSHDSDNNNQKIYLCRRCNCHGRSSEFLAPEFCSLECLKGDSRKRRNLLNANAEKVINNLINVKKEKQSSYLMPAAIKTEKPQMQLNDYIVKTKHFHWANYLRLPNGERYEAANIDKFLNPFPCGPNMFTIHMKLEAIDPENCSLFCVCTVVERKGYRLRLNFDGYPSKYDIWVNADSMDIFPPGWCAKTNRALQPPKYMSSLTFNWPAYLAQTKAEPAPRNLFTHLNTYTANPFKVGMRLEANDIKNSRKICVASVADVLCNRILVHFDGWDRCYDYWAEINSPYIHPVDWHLKNNQELVIPPDWKTKFTWPLYLKATKSLPAVDSMFSPRDTMNFPVNVKLEVVDKVNPSLIRPATIVRSKGHQIKVHWDGWKREYSYWMDDDSPDIHPVGWCDFTGHELEPPPGYGNLPRKTNCPIKGCRGIGNCRRIDIDMHNLKECCPYELSNWLSEPKKPSRLIHNEHPRKIKSNLRNFAQQQQMQPHQQGNNENFSLINNSSKILRQEPADAFTSAKNDKINMSDNILIPNEVVEVEINSSPIAAKQVNSIYEPPEEIFNSLAKEFLCDYGPRLRQSYTIWRSNSSFIPEDIVTNPLTWTTNETAACIENVLHCRQTTELFRQEDIDGVALLSMRQSDLTDVLNLKLGPSVKIFSLILHLRDIVVTKFSYGVNIKTEM